MGQPSYDPSQFLTNIGGLYNNTTGSVDPDVFTYEVDPSANFAAPMLNTPEYNGLYQEWLTRTAFNGGASSAPTSTDYTTAFPQQLNVLFQSWSSNNLDPSKRRVFPRTWGDFITQFRAFFGIPNRAAQSGATAISSTNLNSGPAWDGFLTQFQTTLKTSTDWDSLNANSVSAEFVDSFSGFLGAYPFSGASSTPQTQTTSSFINNWRNFMTVTAVVDPTSATGTYDNLLSYKEAYKAFFPNSTDADFTSAIQAFQIEVNNDKVNGGYFIPSQQFNRFFDEMKNRLLVLTAGQGTMMANAGPKLEIIWQVFATIVKMISVVQKVTAISAQRLGFLTDYQKAYTDLIAAIPTLVNNTPFSADNTSTLNSKLQAYAESLRSYRGILTDDSKGLQSNVNALNESSTQQANLATDLLQQMSSLLSTIMK